MRTLLTIISVLLWGLGGYRLALVAPNEALFIVMTFIGAHLLDMSLQKDLIMRRLDNESDS